jgi:hypothetical protein
MSAGRAPGAPHVVELIADLIDDNAPAVDIADVLGLTRKAVHDVHRRARDR